jgi:glycosyltransferase XagB
MLAVQTLLGGVVVSALAHPFVILTLPWTIGAVGPMPSGAFDMSSLAAMLDGISVLASYAAFIGLGLASSSRFDRRSMRRALLLLPLYWLAISFAAWRAVFQLVTRPHVWEKTPHQPTAFPSQAENGLG